MLLVFLSVARVLENLKQVDLWTAHVRSCRHSNGHARYCAHAASYGQCSAFCVEDSKHASRGLDVSNGMSCFCWLHEVCQVAEQEDSIHAALQAEKQRREAAKKRKEESQRKSAVVQKISTSTAKRMLKSKKQRKLLRTADLS